MAKLLLGKEVTDALNGQLQNRTAALREKGIVPTLGIIRVGANPSDLSYEKGAAKRAELVGVEVYADGVCIGKVKEVLDYPGNSVYVVKGEHEYMIPAVHQFVLSTDMNANRMEVKLIEGMRSDEN